MQIDYHESHPGNPGGGWTADSLKEATQYMLQDRKELFNTIRYHLNNLEKGGTQVINYTVKITVSK